MVVLLASSTSAWGLFARDGRQPPPPDCFYLGAGPPGPRGNVLRIGHSMNVELRREGEEIIVGSGTEGVYQKVTCSGGIPTVNTVDRIVYKPFEGAHKLTIDERGGRFAPGPTAEPGRDEIEILADLPWAKRQRPSSVRIFGVDGADRVRLGQLAHGSIGVDLDVPRRAAHADVDLTVVSPGPLTHFKIEGGNGADRLSAAGTALHRLGWSLALMGDEGADVIAGGRGNDHLSGGEGDDLIRGGEGHDTIVPGEGWDRSFGGGGDDSISESYDGQPDVLDGGGGKDTIYALDGEVERIRCGPEEDTARIDSIDSWGKDCEHLRGPAF